MSSLMNELVEGHIRHHVLSPKAGAAERQRAKELIAIVRSYFR
jgi:DNA-binding FrmR family transcriptional regulator